MTIDNWLKICYSDALFLCLHIETCPNCSIPEPQPKRLVVLCSKGRKMERTLKASITHLQGSFPIPPFPSTTY